MIRKFYGEVYPAPVHYLGIIGSRSYTPNRDIKKARIFITIPRIFRLAVFPVCCSDSKT